MDTTNEIEPQQVPRYLFLTTGVPLKVAGTGNMALAWYWLEAMRDYTVLVVTHRMYRKNRVSAIRKTFGVPSFFYPDASFTGIRRYFPRIAEIIDFILLIICLPFLYFSIRRHRPNRIFALFGGGHFFLIVTWFVKNLARLPLEVSLVDDLAAFAQLSLRPQLIPFINWLEPRIYSDASRVYCISEGYCELLKSKYNIQSDWLPVPGIADPEAILFAPYIPQNPDVRWITFCGSLNQLYADSLKDLVDAIQCWNSESTSFRLGLHLVCMHRPTQFLDSIDKPIPIKTDIGVPRESIPILLRNAWATFLPYSFSQEKGIKNLVKTAFSCKILDSYKAGRPIVAYGPEYGSISRYFRSQELPLIATTRTELYSCLENIQYIDSEKLITQYRDLARALHSQNALRKRLLN